VSEFLILSFTVVLATAVEVAVIAAIASERDEARREVAKARQYLKGVYTAWVACDGIQEMCDLQSYPAGHDLANELRVMSVWLEVTARAK
jgi:hypothetical protein